jgi:DNA-directed RNA polymerase specialized sigma24 family protein
VPTDMVLDLMENPLAAKVHDNDALLLQRFVVSGDRHALEELFLRHSDAAYRLACRLNSNPSDAEDIVQSAFIDVLRSAAQFRGNSSVKAWIMAIVVNQSKSVVRSAVRRRVREDQTKRATGPEVDWRAEQNETVSAAFNPVGAVPVALPASTLSIAGSVSA